MQQIQKTQEKLILRMPANHSLANAIRRSVEEVPTLAIDEVEIFKNDSALYDENLSHRLGLVPLKTDNKMGSKTEITLKLKKIGPGTVYSGDLQGGTKVIQEKIPLTILEKGQEIELVANAKLGKGIEHAKYVPGLCYYRDILEIKSNPKIDKIIGGSKKGIIKNEKKGNKWICDLSESEIDEILKIDNDSIKDSGEILFFVESWGQFDPENVLRKSTEALKNNLKEFEKALK